MKSFSDIAETSYFQTIEFQKIHNFKKILEGFRIQTFRRRIAMKRKNKKKKGIWGIMGSKTQEPTS